MNRHAYLIMAHHQFGFLKDLLLALEDERNDIYLHIDQKVKEFDFDDFSNLLQKSHLYFTERISVTWGGYSQIACEMTLLKAAAPKHYSFYHLLSGSDFPLKTQDEIHQFFEDHADTEFLDFDSPSVPARVRERISLYHFFRESRCPMAEPVDTFLTKLQRFLHVDRLKGSSLKLQKGANWFSITDAFVQYVLEREDWISRTFAHSVCADEMFLQTLAANSTFINAVYNLYGDDNSMSNLRYVDWEQGTENSPYIFQEKDREFLKKLPHLFARKFDRNIFQ
ncbi:MAG: beta-1,6-N-acetylglucosaminyltransferase [Lachnospiraceae bacterium]|nr:beta-1,6-N-acetylglucosaminyltransferase [Lachnospiraceae bacterium]